MSRDLLSKMKLASLLFLALVVALVAAAPAPQKKEPSSASPASGSPFISSFDEIVVESSLHVRSKNPRERSGRNNLVVAPGTSSASTTTTAKTVSGDKS